MPNVSVTPLVFMEGLEPIVKARFSKPSEGVAAKFDLVYPPVDFEQVLSLTHSNAYHGRCIILKSEFCVGYDFKASAAVKRFLEGLSKEEPFLALLKKVAYDLELVGNGYLEIARDRRGRAAEAYHVHGHTVYCRVTDNSLSGYAQEVDGAPVFFVPFSPCSASLNQLLHFKTYTPFSSFYGAPQWISALEALRLDQAKKLFYSAFFRNYAVPALAVVLEGADFDREAASTIRNAFQDLRGVENAHRTMLLSIPFEGAKIRFERLTADLKDLPFEKLHETTTAEILAAHGVPPRLMGVVTSGQLGGAGEAEAQLRIFIETMARPRKHYLEGVVRRFLVSEGLPPEFELLIPDIDVKKQEAGENLTLDLIKSMERLM